MILEHGKFYRTEKDFGGCEYVIEVKKNNLPYYKFSAVNCWEIKDEVLEVEDMVHLREVWSEEGIAYHDDCKCNLISEFDMEAYNARK